MDKKILQLEFDGKHFSVDLEDRPLSVFVDGDSGIVFLDEGPGADRVNGAVLIPDRNPRFSFRQTAATETVVDIDYSGRRLIVGIASCSLDEVSRWVEGVNTLLISKAQERTARLKPTEDVPMDPMDPMELGKNLARCLEASHEQNGFGISNENNGSLELLTFLVRRLEKRVEQVRSEKDATWVGRSHIRSWVLQDLDVFTEKYRTLEACSREPPKIESVHLLLKELRYRVFQILDLGTDHSATDKDSLTFDKFLSSLRPDLNQSGTEMKRLFSLAANVFHETAECIRAMLSRKCPNPSERNLSGFDTNLSKVKIM